MLDHELAGLYGVEARALNQAVKRNLAAGGQRVEFITNCDEFCEPSRARLAVLRLRGAGCGHALHCVGSSWSGFLVPSSAAGSDVRVA
jgi:hypothetical protein